MTEARKLRAASVQTGNSGRGSCRKGALCCYPIRAESLQCGNTFPSAAGRAGVTPTNRLFNPTRATVHGARLRAARSLQNANHEHTRFGSAWNNSDAEHTRSACSRRAAARVDIRQQRVDPVGREQPRSPAVPVKEYCAGSHGACAGNSCEPPSGVRVVPWCPGWAPLSGLTYTSGTRAPTCSGNFGAQPGPCSPSRRTCPTPTCAIQANSVITRC